ncbi:MAG: hypothetical protein ABEN55_11920, partial [Bradymonadaceae bacterium]
MTDGHPEASTSQRLRPAWRPFVGRPVATAAIPAGLVMAASWFFQQPLTSVLGEYAFVAPAVALLVV